jgi:hypothetical protein
MPTENTRAKPLPIPGHFYRAYLLHVPLVFAALLADDFLRRTDRPDNAHRFHRRGLVKVVNCVSRRRILKNFVHGGVVPAAKVFVHNRIESQRATIPSLRRAHRRPSAHLVTGDDADFREYPAVAPLGYLVSRVFQRIPLSQDNELISLFGDIPHGMTLDIPKFLFDFIVVVPGPVENVGVYPDD